MFKRKVIKRFFVPAPTHTGYTDALISVIHVSQRVFIVKINDYTLGEKHVKHFETKSAAIKYANLVRKKISSGNLYY